MEIKHETLPEVNKQLFPRYRRSIGEDCLLDLIGDCMIEIDNLYKKLNVMETKVNMLMLKNKVE